MTVSFDAEIFKASANALLHPQSESDQMIKRFALACFLLDGFDHTVLTNIELEMLIGRFAQVAHLFSQQLTPIQTRLKMLLAEETDFDMKLKHLNQRYSDLFATYPELKAHIDATLKKQAAQLLDSQDALELEHLNQQIKTYDALEKQRLAHKEKLAQQKRILTQKRSHAQQLELEIQQFVSMLNRMKETTMSYTDLEAELESKKQQVTLEKQRFLEKRTQVKQLESDIQHIETALTHLKPLQEHLPQLQKKVENQQEELHHSIELFHSLVQTAQNMLTYLPQSFQTQTQFLQETAHALKIEHKCLHELKQVETLLFTIQNTLKSQIHDTEHKLKAFRTHSVPQAAPSSLL